MADKLNYEYARQYLVEHDLKQSYYVKGLKRSSNWVNEVLTGKRKPTHARDVFGFEKLTKGLCDPRRW